MIKQTKDTLTLYRDDGAPIYKAGKLPDGSYGIMIAKQERRIFELEPVIRIQKQSKKSIEKVMRGY